MPGKTCKELFHGSEYRISDGQGLHKSSGLQDSQGLRKSQSLQDSQGLRKSQSLQDSQGLIVRGIAYRADRVRKDDAFFCIVGLKADGHDFAAEAIERGASVVVVQRELPLVEAAGVVEVVTPDTRKALAQVAARFYGHPSASLEVVGITGTNGKTTTAHLVRHIVRETGKKTGLIGTVGIKVGDEQLKSEHTTPESSDLQEHFARMRTQGCELVSMEVSSHALDLCRVWETDFAVTVFTNLSQDHLDYHKTLESYFESKARLFSADYPAKRVICIDGEFGRELFARCSGAGDEILTTGFDEQALIRPVKADFLPSSTSLELEVCGLRFSFNYPLIGRFNVQNVMSAFAACRCLDIADEHIVAALERVPQIPGRLERVEAAKAPSASEAEKASPAVYVDYAHTPDALAKALASLREVVQGRIIIVFGCGGDRDTTKRPLMGKAALEADYAVVTSDNPRSEDPAAIVGHIVAGMEGSEDRFEVVLDRRRAIRRSLELASSQDTVLIAGKGHEDYQIIGSEKIEFDDRVVAREELVFFAQGGGNR